MIGELLKRKDSTMKQPLVLVRGGGDIASGVIYRLWRAGFPVVVMEIPIPTMIRREVSYGNAVHIGEMVLERLVARHVSLKDVEDTLSERVIPVITESYEDALATLRPTIVVDSILAKYNLGTKKEDAPLVIGVGPGFTASKDVHVVVETKRGHTLGRCIYDGEATPNTGVPGVIGGYGKERVVHSPADGIFISKRHIADTVEKGEVIALVDDVPVKVEISGILRGILQSGLMVTKGFKIADVDPRKVEANCFTISDKSLAIAGGVMEAVTSWMAKMFREGRL